ncbi:MAG: hypothetical protein WCA12_21860 [Burkholderiales bacterium]
MKKLVAAMLIVVACGVVSSCATMAGGMVGAGIGSISGNTGAGMLIGSGVGMMVDIMD